MEVLLLIAILFGIAYAIAHRRGRTVASADGWEQAVLAGGRAELSVPGPGVRFGDQRDAAKQLARVEGRMLRRHEAFIVGCLLWMILVVVYGGLIWREYSGGLDNSWRFLFANLPVMSLPYCGMVLIAADLGALRSRRDHVDELFSTLPTRDAARVSGHIGSVWMALLAQAVFVVAVVVLNIPRNHPFGAIDAASWGDVAVSFVLVVCAVAFGVCISRWAPFVLAGPLALVALAMVGTRIGGIGEHHWSPTRQLSIWPRYPDHDLLFAVRPTWWHAVYLLALAAFVALVAIARHRRDRTIGALIVGSLAVAAVAGYLQTRPMSAGRASEVADQVARPLDHASCIDRDGLRLCAYPDYADVMSVWAPNLGPSFAAAPASVRADGFTVVWRETDLDRLDPLVRDRIDEGAIEASIRSETDVWSAVSLGSEGAEPRVDRLVIGLWAAGLPLHPARTTTGDDLPCAVGGQARGVVALWVAAQGDDLAHRRELVSGSWTGVDNPDWGPDLPQSWLDGFVWDSDSIPPVLWSSTDLGAADQVVSAPQDAVREVLWEDWSHWTDPATTTDELLAALDLEPVGSPGMAPEGTAPCP